MGCYYHMIGDFENARRYFSKSTTIDHRFAPAWVGFGHAFAAQDESDQAMAAYRTASRLFPGSHVPWRGTGLEDMRTMPDEDSVELTACIPYHAPAHVVAKALGQLAGRGVHDHVTDRALLHALEDLKGTHDAKW